MKTSTLQTFFLLTALGCIPLGAENLLRDTDSFLAYSPEGSGAEQTRNNGTFYLTDTSKGRAGNAGSTFKFVLSKNSAALKRINAVLARSIGSAPVDFAVSFKIREDAVSSRFISADFRLMMNGARVPEKEPIAYSLDLKELRFTTGKTLFLNEKNTPVLRFSIRPSGGKNQVDSIDFLFSIRVDNGATPETFAISDLSLTEVGTPPGEKAKKTALFSDSAPSGALISALAEQGFRTVRNSAEPTGAIVFLSGRFDQPNYVKRYLDAVKNGSTVLIDFRIPVTVRKEMENFLPLNPWSVKRNDLKRPSDALKGFPGSGITLKESLFLGVPLDLHLPGSPMENSMNRYLWKEYEKPLNNTDWEILLTTRAGIPALIRGKIGNADVFVFGGDFSDPSFVSSPGYPEFSRQLAAKMVRNSQSSTLSHDLSALKIEIPQVQGGELFVNVKNTGNSPLNALLSYQTANWEREILNSKTVPVSLKPGETQKVILQERGAFKGNSAISESGSAIPYLRIRAGVLGSDRGKVFGETRENVFRGKELQLNITENTAFWPEKDNMAQTDGEFDGSAAARYVLPVGTEPELVIGVGNRFANIAPLAKASDLKWSENPTAEGLNDLSLSRANARKNGLYQGGWAAKAAPEQSLSLAWEFPVTIGAVGIEGYGTYRRENHLNPVQFTMKEDGGRTIVQENAAEYKENGSSYYTRYGKAFSPVATKTLRMDIAAQMKNRANMQLGGTNCTVKELEVFGWPGERKDTTLSGTLEIIRNDLVKNTRETVFTRKLTIPAYTQKDVAVKLPSKGEFGPVRYDIVFKASNGAEIRSQYDVLYQEPGHVSIIEKKTFGEYQPGLLCTPGWYNYDSFGRGMIDWTRGWGGPHDKIWALTHGLMETGAGNTYAPDRMFTTNTRNSHYTNPWRYLPDGSYGWDLTAAKIMEEAQKRYPNQKTVHVVGSDRWNGIPVGNSYGWDMFLRFDEWLKAKNGGKGLEARSFRGIANEINTRYANIWQKWQMEHYAEKLVETQKLFADQGLAFTFETHGSFPFAGNEFGDKLGKTHLGVGTDLFWELRNQDLYWSLGTRFAIIAANPNFRSGLYKQWGWVNSESNAFWFANNASVEPARRQWYSTYFAGRVDSEGKFLPYHVYGYGLQGGISTKFHRHEISAAARTLSFTASVRPEEAAGFGFVVSWDSHEKRMTPKAGIMGLGLYASGGSENQLEYRMGKLYELMVKNGLPVGFVTSSHALEKWNGKNPLLILDATDWNRKELDRLDRLNSAGAPVIAFAGDDRSNDALQYWISGAEKRSAGGMEFYLRNGGAPVIYCPFKAQELPAESIQAIVKFILKETGYELSSSSSMPVTPFISQNALFLAFGTQADFNQVETIRINPKAFYPALDGKKLVFVDMDTQHVIDTVKNNSDGSLEFTLPTGAVSGRLVMIKSVED